MARTLATEARTARRVIHAFRPSPLVQAVRIALIQTALEHYPAPQKPVPKRKAALQWDALSLSETLRIVHADCLDADPLVNHLCGLLEAESANADGFAHEADRVSADLAEAKARIERLESVLRDEGIPPNLWS